MKNNGDGLMAFLDYVVEKGLMNKNTAGGLRSACKEVLQAVDGDGWGGIDLSTLDVADYSERFERLRMGKYNPASLSVYKNRFRGATAMFSEYLASPSTWRFSGRRQANRQGPDVVGKPSRKSGSQSPPSPPATVIPPVLEDAGSPTVDYPFPLRPGLLVRLRLPEDLSKAEAKRLAAFLDSVAVEIDPVDSEPAS